MNTPDVVRTKEGNVFIYPFGQQLANDYIRVGTTTMPDPMNFALTKEVTVNIGGVYSPAHIDEIINALRIAKTEFEKMLAG